MSTTEQKRKAVAHHVTTQANAELLQRGAEAGKEFLIAHCGVDNATGKTLQRSLAGIAKSKINADPVYAQNNLRQQAGFSAEVKYQAKENVNAILTGDKTRTARTEDLPHLYSKNHPTTDTVQVNAAGQAIPGSAMQIKLINDPKKLLRDIVEDGKRYNKYQDQLIGLPSEQVAPARQYCADQSRSAGEQAQALQRQGKADLANKKHKEADMWRQKQNDIRDIGMTREDALLARKHPRLGTSLDMLKTAHTVANEAAKMGMVISGSVALVSNVFAVAQGKKELQQALGDAATDTAKAGAVTYGTTLVANQVLSVMHNSPTKLLRTLGNTNVVPLVVSFCLSVQSSIRDFANGKMDGAALSEHMGEQAVGLYASVGMGVLGQTLIPIPVVGALVGSLTGSLVAQGFYQAALDSRRTLAASKNELIATQKRCAEAREAFALEHAKLQHFMATEFAELKAASHELLGVLGNPDPDTFAHALNSYAREMLGRELQFATLAEFEAFMQTDDPLVV